MERLTRDDLSRYQQALLALYLKRLEYRDAVGLYAFEFARDVPTRSATVLAARISLPCSDGTSLWFTGTLGVSGQATRVHEHQFISVLDTEALDAAEWVCAAYHYDRYVEQLDHGHTFPLLPTARLRGRGYGGTLVTEAGFFRHFSKAAATVSGVRTMLFAVLPVTEEDLAFKRARGLDALLDDWTRVGRDALQFAVEVS